MQNQNYIRTIRKPGLLSRIGLSLIALLLSLSLVACGNAAYTTTDPPTTNAATTVAATSAATTTSASATTAAATTASNSATTVAASATATKGSASVSQPVQQATAAATSTDQIESNTVVGVVQKLSPAVVTVYNKARITGRTGTTGGNNNNRLQPTATPAPDGTDPSLRTQGIGSGVIISDQGYIVTNAHVVEGEQGISVAFNNGQKVVTAKVVGVDTVGDIAVLKIDGAVPAVAKFGDSSKLQVGETVIAIGAALGDFRNSVTKGVVSGLNRTLDTSPSVYVQTDAPINHGNSGGPLLNLKGEIIGINTAVLRSTPGATGSSGDVAEALGFAIPSNTAKLLSDQLISKGQVARPYFGITYQMITPAIAGTTIQGTSVPAVEGAWIYSSRGTAGIVSGSPADKAGLKNNDVITAVDGITLNDNNPLVSVILNYKPGDTVKLTVQRGDQTLNLNLTLGERPANP